MLARDERVVCEVERGHRREGYGATGSPWNAANRALVTADRFFVATPLPSRGKGYAAKFRGWTVFVLPLLLNSGQIKCNSKS